MTHKYLVLRNVKYNLEKILKEDGYTFDVGLVDLSQLDVKTIAPTPAVIIVERSLKRNYLAGGVMEFRLTYSLIPVVRLTDVEDATDILYVLNEFEADITRCHHEDLFLRTAFTENPEVPAEKQGFYLMDQKMGDAVYFYTKERGHALIDVSAEYTIVGQEEI